MCFNPSPERRVPSPNRYMAFARFCFCKNNKRMIIRSTVPAMSMMRRDMPYAPRRFSLCAIVQQMKFHIKSWFM